MLHFLRQLNPRENYQQTGTAFGFQDMYKKDDNSRPLGICHRLINFIINNLIGQGHKRVTLDRSPPPPLESTEVPIAGSDSSRNMKNIMPSKSDIGNGAWNPEVIIDFRHIEEPVSSTPVHKLSSAVGFPEKNGLIAIGNSTILQKGKERRRSDARGVGKGHRVEIEIASAIKGKESAEDPYREKHKQKEKHIPTETTPGTESEDAKRKPLIRPSWPLLMSVASNINEKADAFIRSRKEAMSKHYSFEHPRKF